MYSEGFFPQLQVRNLNTYTIKTSDEPYISKLVRWSWMLLLGASFLQVFIFSVMENMVAVVCTLFAWLITTKMFLKHDVLKIYPLSAFLIIGFAATQFYFPLVFTLLEGKPVIFNLELPLTVYFHSIAALVILVAVHYIYRQLPIQTYRGQNSILNRMGFFNTPSPLQIWLMGALGLGANIYVFFFSPSVATEISGAASDKAIFALLPFTYAPYFIPFTPLYGGNSETKISKKVLHSLLAYTVVLFIISMARNSRGAFMIGFTSVGFSYLLALLLGVMKPPVIALKTIIIAIVGLWLITGPMSDLGMAMVMVRSQRDDMSKSELIDRTLEAYKDKAAIKLRKLQDEEVQSDWDEKYLDNIFTARFANIKYNDISLVQAAKIGEKNKLLKQFSIDYIWGALPTPVLKALNPSINKETLYTLSFGDYIYALSGAGNSVYGGFRTGHFAGTGMGAFGLWYLAILGVFILPVYLLLDKLVISKPTVTTDSNAQSPQLCFSLCGLLALTSIFQFLPTESVVIIITFLLRGWFQMVLLYFFLFQITRMMMFLIPTPAANR